MTTYTSSTSTDHRVIAREEEAFSRAAEADQRIQTGKNFGDWLAIGSGLASLRDRTMRESFSNGPFGRSYTARYGALKAAHAWAAHYDSGTISHTIWLRDHVDDVVRWRETLSNRQRQEWTTPKVLRQHYERMAKAAAVEGKGEVPARISLQDQVIRLQAEIDMLLRGKAGGAWAPSVSAEDFADTLADHHSPRILRLLIAAMTKRVEVDERAGRIEASKRKRKG